MRFTAGVRHCLLAAGGQGAGGKVREGCQVVYVGALAGHWAIAIVSVSCDNVRR